MTSDNRVFGDAQSRVVLGLPQQAWEAIGRLSGLLAVAMVTLALSWTLAKMSGTALRLPPPWGVSVQAVMVALGVGIFALFRNLNALRRDKQVTRTHKQIDAGDFTAEEAAKEKRDAEKRVDMVFRVRSRWAAVLAMLVVLTTVFVYQYMHRRCGWEFTVPVREDGVNWYWAEWGEGTAEDWLRANPRVREAMLESINLPMFLVRESSKIYMPLTIPADVKQQIIDRGRSLATSTGGETDATLFARGRSELLHRDVLRLISYIQSSEEFPRQMERTQLYFYLLHASVIVLVGMSAGLTFAPEQAIRRILEQASAEDLIPA